MIKRYKKKPVVVEAILLEATPASVKKVLEFMGQKVDTQCNAASDAFERYCNSVFTTGMNIHTLEGILKASVGDYVIRGIGGEFYPCKPDIFMETYENI